MSSSRFTLLLVLSALSPSVPAYAAHAQTANIETAPRLRLVEELRIGNASDPTLGFSRIGPAAVDRDGNLFVFEMQDLQMRVYSAAGKLVRTIGRRGEGPGEFAEVPNFGLTGDTLYTIGRSSGCGAKVVLFRRDGSLISTLQSPGLRVSLQGTSIGVARPQWLRPDGKFVAGEVSCFTGGGRASAVAGRGGSGGPPPPPPAPTDTVRVPRVLFDSQGAISDTLGWYLVPPTERPRRDTVVIDGRRHPVPIPNPDSPISTALIDGRITVERRTPRTAAQATIRVTRTRLMGDTVFSRVLSYAPTRYTNTVLDSIAKGSARTPGGFYAVVNGVPQITPFTNVPAAEALIRSKMDYPPFQMPVSSVFLSEDQSLWLQREDDGGANFHWSLLDRQGQLRGNLDIPRRSRIAWSSGDIVWLVLPDADDVPWMVRFRIARGS